MRKHMVALACSFVVFLIGIVMGGCSSKSPTQQAPVVPQAAKPAQASAPAPAPKPQVDRSGWPVIVAFGDSLTFGQGVTAERNYPSQLQEALDKAGYKYRVVNAGISGDTSAGGLGRVEAVVRQKPQIVILELGANDGLRGQPVPEMKKNLATIIERLQKEQITVVLAGMQIPPNYGPEYTQAFKQTFEDLAKQYKLTLIPFFLDGVGGRPELNQTDGIHPTADGYVYVVNNVVNVLKPLLKQ